MGIDNTARQQMARRLSDIGDVTVIEEVEPAGGLDMRRVATIQVDAQYGVWTFREQPEAASGWTLHGSPKPHAGFADFDLEGDALRSFLR